MNPELEGLIRAYDAVTLADNEQERLSMTTRTSGTCSQVKLNFSTIRWSGLWYPTTGE